MDTSEFVPGKRNRALVDAAENSEGLHGDRTDAFARAIFTWPVECMRELRGGRPSGGILI